MLELYHSGLTTCSKQVRHCAAREGAEVREPLCRAVALREFEFGVSQAQSEWRGTDAGARRRADHKFVLHQRIHRGYLFQSVTAPRRPQGRARMRYWAWTADEVHLMLARLTHALMLQQGLEGLTAEERAVMLANTPVPEKRERWRILTKGGYSDEQLQTALDNVLFIFVRVEEELRNRGPWLAGGTFSLGDISMIAIVHRIFQLYPDRLDRSAFPKLNDWWNRTMARPAAKYVYTDGLEETPKRPSTKSIAGIAEFRV